MKKVLLASLVLLASQTSVFAAFPGSAPCAVLEGCTDQMKEIWNGFSHAGALRQDLIPSVYSGECYYLGSLYDPNERQWGYDLIDSHEGGVYADGWLSFHSSENPYVGLTVEKARERSPEIYESGYKLTLFEDYAFRDLTTPNGSVLQTWYRQSADGNQLYTYGTWGIDTRRFCHFQRHSR